jgi:ABC-type cobalamin/Fe3+-siderophores transport system ATPase subunit
MISELTLRFGSALGTPAAPIPITPVTIFVGPNNSGKSKILAEIERFCRTGEEAQNDLLLQRIRFQPLTQEQISGAVDAIRDDPRRNEMQQPGHIFVQSSRGGRGQLDLNQLTRGLETAQPGIFASWFLRHFLLKLDGPNRVQLVDEQSAGDLLARPATSLQVLFQDDDKRKQVRRVVHEAFGFYFVVDPTNLGRLRIRLSSRAPNSDLEERNIHQEGVAFHSQATPIDQTSDGVKAFIGIIVELIAGDPRVLLIDEPEAFLHPSLAMKLGYEVSRAAAQSEKRIFASTHSPQFVMGCIQSGVPINIVRLTYRAGIATARLLPSDELIELMRNPLLRSTGVLSGLFYENVVATESDADRAFYQEINERLLRFKPNWGIPNCLFLNSQGKHTLHTIMQPLRKLGIPTAGIVDVDVLKDIGAQWSGFMDGANIPQTSRQALATWRTDVRKAIDATRLDMKRDGGIAILQDGPREAAESLITQMAEYGMFVVPGGELESWLKPLGATGHGPGWLIDIFTRMGEDPEAEQYRKGPRRCRLRGFSDEKGGLVAKT